MPKGSRISASSVSRIADDAFVSLLSLVFIGSFFYMPPVLVRGHKY